MEGDCGPSELKTLTLVFAELFWRPVQLNAT
jgi:hypothetical protein